MSKYVQVEVTKKQEFAIYLCVPDNFKNENLTEKMVRDAVFETKDDGLFDCEISWGQLHNADDEKDRYEFLFYDVEDVEEVEK